MPSDTASKKAPLDELMMAMDVVDTLRHDERIALKELDADQRDEQMIDRLRDLYQSQGIEVPDRILHEGVESLKQNRFVYAPPAAGLQRTLALVYVTRMRWGKWLLIALLVMAAAVLAWRYLVVAPRERAAEALRIELSETLPEEASVLRGRISDLAEVEAARTQAETLAAIATSAAAAGDAQAARGAIKDLRALETRLRETYEVRIVSRPGVPTGVTRIPDVNRATRNYYLVVEAVAPGGKVLQREIVSEEDDEATTVGIWAQRVPKTTFDAVRQDKEDDGIVQNAILGTKASGRLEPVWNAAVETGAITKW
ncbi:DUF6384 family protein [Stappia sp. ES.058]|uniref:DUF6384 family protein n=1 Tax=Stappia sp. ES.058 TaxID=1881061 RepID=UPI00087C4752|nr:DUF6384 family protein [Stappia sp. ES.058]SDU23928.1 hypothetical protein SAMN05428979_2473 [Stappia sp. ES.058]